MKAIRKTGLGQSIFLIGLITFWFSSISRVALDIYLFFFSFILRNHQTRTNQPPQQQQPQLNHSPNLLSHASYSFFRFLSKTVTSYLPTQVTDVFSQGRAFASVTLPEAGVRRMCAITTIQKQLRWVLDRYSDCRSICTENVKKHQSTLPRSVPFHEFSKQTCNKAR